MSLKPDSIAYALNRFHPMPRISRQMPSSPLLVMVSLASVVVVGYMGLSHYALRQDVKDVAILTERNVKSLNKSMEDCIHNRDAKNEVIKKLEAYVNQVNKQKSDLETAAKDKGNAQGPAMTKATAERDDLAAKLAEANKKVDALTKELAAYNKAAPAQPAAAAPA
ncbi:uncharacterized protein [Macrobrachium rosenbergii]|uniref:uncharacterized protein n=1 Tax=Macrobrachium rosenbergii TaxID=79674 RepID=UPI0034D7132B